MAIFFEFEADFIHTMRCIPMVVRYNLDTCGVKLKLAHWLAFSPAERHELAIAPCDTPAAMAAYKDRVQSLVIQHTGAPAATLPLDPQPAWLDAETIPATVLAKLENMAQILTLDQWRSLSPLQRFVLIKLSHPSHENKNFLPALREFKL